MNLVEALPYLKPFIGRHPIYRTLKIAWMSNNVSFPNEDLSLLPTHPYYLLRCYIRNGEVTGYKYVVDNKVEDISKLHELFYEIVQDLKNNQELKILMLRDKLGVKT